MRNENADIPRKFSCQYVLQTNSIAQNTENEMPARAPNRAGLLLKQKKETITKLRL